MSDKTEQLACITVAFIFYLGWVLLEKLTGFTVEHSGIIFIIYLLFKKQIGGKKENPK